MRTEFFGLTKDNINYEDSLSFIQYQVYDLCNKNDAVLTAGPERNFDLLCYLTINYNSIQKKVFDLGRL